MEREAELSVPGEAVHGLVVENALGELRRVSDPAKRIAEAEAMRAALPEIISRAQDEIAEGYGYPPLF